MPQTFKKFISGPEAKICHGILFFVVVCFKTPNEKQSIIRHSLPIHSRPLRHLLTRGSELLACGSELLARGSELLAR